MKNVKGKLVVFEGLDGSGKTTQIETLLRKLRRLRIPNVAMREPGGTPIGEDIRKILKTPYTGNQKTPMTELLLFFASRATVVNQIREMLDKGITVVMDRFYLSSLAYQGRGLGLNAETLALCSMVLGDLRPDLTIVLDVPSEVGLERSLARSGSHDDIESRDLAYFNRVRQCFIDYSETYDALVPHCYLVDGTQSVDKVAELVNDLCVEYDIYETA